ncbi:MAG: hypothetical protein M3312_06765, partial [Actinomycetota bacterium]|nr:hypothetical protein [Actinomycetota bacterium]
DPALDEQTFGVELWSVTDPRNPYRLGVFPAATGDSGVHELDLVQRGGHVYALLATPFTEWFDPSHAGDFRIVDVTNPRAPVQIAEWGAGAHGLSPGPFYGLGSFGSRFAHSARASANGMRAYVSYWDLGTLTFDISDPRNPVLVSRTQRYPRTSDGDAHSVSEYRVGGRHFLLQNNEDFDPRSPATIYLGAVPRSKNFVATESPGGAPLWLEPRHRIADGVVRAANEGCEAGDYPANADGRIVVVRTPFHEFDPGGGAEPECEQSQQEEMAEAAGAVAVVHDFISSATSPQWFGEPGDVDIPVLFVRHRAANAIVADGFVTLRGRWPGWGVLAIYNAETGRRVAIFDRVPNVHRLPAPPGDWSIHNSEVAGDRAYMSWYTNGIVAANLRPLLAGDEPTNVGQWVPPGAPSRSEFVHTGVAEVWGVAIRRSDNLILASDMNSGLWILRATGPAAP